MFCGEASTGHFHEGALHINRLTCRSWHCEHCHPARLRRLRRDAAAGQPTTLITLTINPEPYQTPNHAARQLVRAWRNIVQRARREGLADHIAYLAVFEETKQGWPHLHILARCPYLPQRWLSDRMREYAASPIVDIRRVYSARHASRYIAKYVSKGPGAFEGCKRYWRSLDYCEPPVRKEKPVADCRRGWKSPFHWVDQAERHLRAGWECIDDGPDGAILVPHRWAQWIAPIPPPPEVADLRADK